MSSKKHIPHRNNPKVITNWFHTKTKNFLEKKGKKSYYEISTKKKGWLQILFREEKKRLGGSQEREEFWYSYLEFKLNTQLAKDLKMFLNEYVDGHANESKEAKKKAKNE